MRYFFILVLLFMPNYGFTLSILDYVFGNKSNVEKQIPIEDKMAIEAIDSTIEKLKKKYDFYPSGMGIDGDNGKIHSVYVSLDIFYSISKEDARVMLFDCIEELIKNINSHKKLKPYLKKYPFGIKEIRIAIYIQDKDLEDFFHPDICLIKSTQEGVTFRTNDPEDTYKYKETVEETHEEALALVKKYRAEKGK